MSAVAERTGESPEAREDGVGLVVALKSGGPPMTVYDVGRYTGRLLCCWYDESGVLRTDAFSRAALKLNSTGGALPSARPG